MLTHNSPLKNNSSHSAIASSALAFAASCCSFVRCHQAFLTMSSGHPNAMPQAA
uniref:Uncharacterized protein n=1 Tax=uncultured marine virus TaxID=186617 RepID=A0A0F7L5E0_9VIRU|nr:hypothetical protein [uncultured marine virus]